MPLAPTGRPIKAQANGLGRLSSPYFGSQALKGRDKDRPCSLGDIGPRPSHSAISPFQGSQPDGKGFSNPGRLA
jgi:hypothetical protein